MVAFINEHWVAYLVGLSYLLGVFCAWHSSLFSPRDWWLAFVAPLIAPFYLARREPGLAIGLLLFVLFVRRIMTW